MDYITKNKIATFLIVMLCCTNIAVVVFLLKVFPGPDRGPHGQMMMRDPMADRLNLTEEQLKQIRSLRWEHDKQLHKLFEKTDSLKKQMVGFVFEDQPDQQKINEIASELGRMNAEFELSQMHNMQEIIKILTPAQVTEFKRAMDEIDGSGRPGGFGGPGGFGAPGHGPGGFDHGPGPARQMDHEKNDGDVNPGP